MAEPMSRIPPERFNRGSSKEADLSVDTHRQAEAVKPIYRISSCHNRNKLFPQHQKAGCCGTLLYKKIFFKFTKIWKSII